MRLTLRGKSTIAMKENQDVSEGDKVRTQSTGRVRILLTDGSILNVGSSSMMTVRASTDTSRSGSLDLAYGNAAYHRTQFAQALDLAA